MSAKIILDNIITSSEPGIFTDDISFDVTFSVLQPITHPLSWKIIYVGSAYSQDYDQVLEQFEIDPIQNCGTMKFQISCSCPDPSKIPRKELISVTALLLTASYRNQQFIRVGYYVHNQLIMSQSQDIHIDEMNLEELIKRIKRTIISDKPRVTKFNICWRDLQKSKEGKIGYESQLKLSECFSNSMKSQNSELESSSQKISLKEDNEKHSTQEQNQIMMCQ